MHIPHRMVAPADGLGECHAIGHRNGLREALDDIGRSHSSDKRHRPVSVPPRLFAIRGASHVRDATKTDRFGGLHALFEQPDTVIADGHGASERRQVHENQTVFDRDGVRSAIRRRNERCGILPLQLALLGYGMLFHRPAAADAEIISAVHAAADRDLAVRIEGQGSMLPVHTFQQYRAFTLRQETGIHRLMHNLAVGIDVGCEGRVAKSERHHADLGEMYRHAVWPMPDLPFKGYGKLLLRVEDVDGNSNAIAQLCTACVPCDNLESFCRMTVRDHRDVVERWDFVLIVVHQLQFDGV